MDSCDSDGSVEEKKVNVLNSDEGSKSENYGSKTTGEASIGESVTPPPNATDVSAGEGKLNDEGREVFAGVKTESESAMEAAIKQAVKQIERFRRTQSEKLKREMSIKAHRELQRSETVGRRRLLVASDDGMSAMSSETVEKLSNEEFQLAVETFISKQQSFLKQEGMAENGTKL